MTEDEKNIVAFVESKGKKGCISPLYEEKKVYNPEDEPSPSDLKITLRIPVKTGEFDDQFNLILLRLPAEESTVDAHAEVTGIRMLDIGGYSVPTNETNTFLSFGQRKSDPFKKWLNEVFWEWYNDWEEKCLASKREHYKKEKEERLNWLPNEKSRAMLGDLVKNLA